MQKCYSTFNKTVKKESFQYVYFIFNNTDPPRPPTLEVVGSTSSSVTLKWIKNSDVSPVTGKYVFTLKTFSKLSSSPAILYTTVIWHYETF